jgi:Zn-dependent protease with chaperone function
VLERKRLMRLPVVAVVCLVLAGCASGKPPDLRGATPQEQAKVDEVLMPLVQASGICRPKEPCAVGLAIEPRQRIHVAAGPAPQKKFVLRITTGALRSLQPSELQAALAHELGHVQLGHFESREVRRQAERPSKTAMNGAGDEILRTNRASDREEEFAADSYAVALLDRLPGSTGQGCTDMLLLLERLDLEQLTAGWANWLSTHPTPGVRLQALQAKCDKKP